MGRLSLIAGKKKSVEDDTEFENMEKVEEERACLLVRIKRWIESHILLVGTVLEQMKEDDSVKEIEWPGFPDTDTVHPEDIELLLPSAYPNAIRSHTLFKALVDAEYRMREGQANDFLSQIRTKLTVLAFMKTKKNEGNVQKEKTRNSDTVKKSKDAVSKLREEYNATFDVMERLNHKIDTERYKTLEEDDCNPPPIYFDDEVPGDSRWDDLSWIWSNGHEKEKRKGEIKTWSNEGKYYH